MDIPDDKDSLSELFLEEADAHEKKREELLANEIRVANEWIKRMKDPALGTIGREFVAKADASGVKQSIDIFFNNAAADYVSFSFSQRHFGFINEITYGPSSEENLPRLFSAKVHETTHALQKMQSAALHASPFNPDTQIVICPRDWVTLEERCEQDAYTKQAYFNTILSAYIPKVVNRTDVDPVSVADFQRFKESTGDVRAALVEAARQSLTKSFYSDNPNSEYRFANCIQDQALKNYEAGMAARRKRGDTNIVFVRLEPEDIEAIGASCGPNVFGTNGVLPEFLKTPSLLPKTQQKLDDINATCGITNADALPTLSEALARIGLTRAEFIAQAYSRQSAAAAKPAAPPAAPGA